MKSCPKCNITKSFDQFYKDRSKKDGYESYCKPCSKLIKTGKVQGNTTIKLSKLQNQGLKCCTTCKQNLPINNFGVDNSRSDNLFPHCNNCRDKRGNKYRQEYREQLHQKELIKCHSNVGYRLMRNQRARIRFAIKRNFGFKMETSTSLLGCTFEELKIHLESQFSPGMTWENYGKLGWEIDHKRPCTSFDLTDSEQQKQCFHFTNLQPLWQKQNASKGGKYE